MSNFGYPTFSRSQITALLAETEIAPGVTDNELKQPSRDFVGSIYVKLLTYIGVYNEEEQGQIAFDGLERFENPDHHAGSVNIIDLHRKVKVVLDQLDCPYPFTLKDLSKPEGARTEFFISAILNFCLYRDDKMDRLRPLIEDLTMVEEQGKEFESKLLELDEEIAERNNARENDLPLVQELEAKVKELKQNIENLNSQQSVLRNLFRKSKEKAADIDKEIFKTEFNMVQASQENATLQSKIVQSPDKLQNTLEEKKSVRENVQNSERLAMQTFQEKSDILEVYTKAFKKMSKDAAQLQSVNEQANAAKSIGKNCKLLKAQLAEDGVLYRSLDAKLAEQQMKAEQLAEANKQLEQERDLVIEDADRQLNDIKSEVESRRRELEESQRKVESVVGEMEAIAEKTNQVKQSAAATVQKYTSKSDELTKQFQQYVKSFNYRVFNKLSQDSKPTTGFAI